MESQITAAYSTKETAHNAEWVLPMDQIQTAQPFKQLATEFKTQTNGIRNYFGLPDNSRSVSKLYDHVLHSLFKWLNRRSGRKSYNWCNFKKMLDYFHIEPLKVSKRVIKVDWY